MVDYDLEEALGMAFASLPRSLDDRLGLSSITKLPIQQERPVTQRRREQLAMEAARHREKAEKAEAHLKALEGIPDRDPFPNGTILKAQAGVTYALLRAADRWYLTGATTPNNISWPTLVDWLTNRGITTVTPMEPGKPTLLGALESPAAPQEELTSDIAILPVRDCEDPEGHTPHAWRGVRLGSGDAPRPYWCRGA